MSNLINKFSKCAAKVADAMGHPIAFLCAVLLIVGWALAGNHFQWSEAHSLFINTLTTIVTFLLGFLILNTSIRSGKAEQLKLDELIRAIDKAENHFVKLEEKGIVEIKIAEEEFKEKMKSEDDSE